MTDIVLKDIKSGYNLNKINDNFEKVEDVINTEMLHTTGGNNVMSQHLDMNSRRVLNLPAPSGNTEPLRKGDITTNTTGATVQYVDDSTVNSLSLAYTFDTVAEFKASAILFPDGKTIHLNDRNANFTKITGNTTTDDTSVIYSTSVNQSIELIQDGRVDVSALGVIYGIAMSRAECSLVLKCGVKKFAVSGNWMQTQGCSQPVNTDVEFIGDGKVTITTPFFAVWAFEGGPAVKTRLTNPVLDGANIAGCNGLGVGGSGLGFVENVVVTNPIYLNCKRQPSHLDTYNGGGRGMMIESDVVDIQISNPQSENCTSGYAYQCTTAKPADRVTVINPIARNCMHYAEFLALSDFSNTPDSGDMGGINIIGGYAYNCGLGEIEYYSGDGVFDANRDTGVIMCERARHVTWRGFKIHNVPSYGQVGAVVRGTGFHLNFDGEMIGSVVSPHDTTFSDMLLPIGGGNPAPSGSSINSRGILSKIKLVGDTELAYRCQTPDTGSTGHLGHKIDVSLSSNPTVELIDVPTARADAYLHVYNYNTGTDYIGSFNKVVADGNTMPSNGATETAYSLLTMNGNTDIKGVFRSQGDTYLEGSNIFLPSLPTTTGLQNRVARQSTPDTVNFDYVMVKK